MALRSIAILAPEIPSLSQTFVYNEIFGLQDRGIEIVPISIHIPVTPAIEEKARLLSSSTYFVYPEPWYSILSTHIWALFRNPLRYSQVLFALIKDIFSLYSTPTIWIKLVYQFLKSGYVADVIVKRGIQHIHIHFSHVSTQVGMYASIMSGIPFTFVVHANDLFVHKLLLKQKANRAKKIISVSDYNKDYLIKQDVALDKIELIRCGISINTIKYNPRKIPPQAIRIGSLGRLVEKKGMDTLIISLSKLLCFGYDCKLYIAGDGPLLPHLKSLATSLNIEEHIIFVGALSHEAVFKWLDSLDIFVLACKKDKEGDQDGIPVALMEAMAVGVPVVSTIISGIPELIQNKSTGFLAEPNDPDSLTSAIVSAIIEPNILEILHSARSHVCLEFDRDVNIERLLSVIDN